MVLRNVVGRHWDDIEFLVAGDKRSPPPILGQRHSFYFIARFFPNLSTLLECPSLRGRRLEVVGARKNGRLSRARSFLRPLLSKRLLPREGMPELYWLICMEYGREGPGVKFKVRLMSP